MKRTVDFNQNVSLKLQRSKKYAQSFLSGLLEDNLTVEESLKFLIRVMGVRDFARLVGYPSSKIGMFLNGTRKPKPETLDEFLKPFGMRTRVILEKAG